jgi:hypothetical protein
MKFRGLLIQGRPPKCPFTQTVTASKVVDGALATPPNAKAPRNACASASKADADEACL